MNSRYSTKSWWAMDDGEWHYHAIHQHPGKDGQPVRDTYRDGRLVKSEKCPE